MELDLPAVGIIRGVGSAFFSELMAASFEAGLTAIELTMNTKNADRIVSRVREKVPPGKLLGMGTIRNIEEAKRAADAGAMFFVTPNVDREVIGFAAQKKIPIIAGALTPTEVYTAWTAGATMVKVFPAGAFGPRYLKDLSGPFEDIPLVAVGGITYRNVNAYFDAGAKAVGVSSALFGKEALEHQDIDGIFKNVELFCNQLKRYKGLI